MYIFLDQYLEQILYVNSALKLISHNKFVRQNIMEVILATCSLRVPFALILLFPFYVSLLYSNNVICSCVSEPVGKRG